MQDNIMREAQTMILIGHPNVVKAHCSFAKDQTLWVVMPYMGGGSCLHIMKSVYPDGFEEAIVATVLREVLKGLEYLHHHGHIHRDVKVNAVPTNFARVYLRFWIASRSSVAGSYIAMPER
jgi:serine/threonine-protein kinase OSR1/STK39